MIDPAMDEIARAEADYHVDCFRSCLSLQERQRVWNVIYEIALSALQTYDGLGGQARYNRSLPPRFSLN
jgi:hypothetical protein